MRLAKLFGDTARSNPGLGSNQWAFDDGANQKSSTARIPSIIGWLVSVMGRYFGRFGSASDGEASVNTSVGASRPRKT